MTSPIQTIRAEIDLRQSYRIAVTVEVSGPSDKPPALVAFTFFDALGRRIEGRWDGFMHSERFGLYRYVGSAGVSGRAVAEFAITPPLGATSMKADLRRWRAQTVKVMVPLRLLAVDVEAPLEEQTSLDELEAPALAFEAVRTMKPSLPNAAAVETSRATDTPLAELASPVAPGDEFEVVAQFSASEPIAPRTVIAALIFLNASGLPLPPPAIIPHSKRAGSYSYLELSQAGDQTLEGRAAFFAPPDAAAVQVRILRWGAPEGLVLLSSRLNWPSAEERLVAHGEMRLPSAAELVLTGALTGEILGEKAALIDVQFYDVRGTLLLATAAGLSSSAGFANCAYIFAARSARRVFPSSVWFSVAFWPPALAFRVVWRIRALEAASLACLETPKLQPVSIDPKSEHEALNPVARRADNALSTATTALLHQSMSVKPLWEAVARRRLRLLGEWLGPVRPGGWLELSVELTTPADLAEARVAVHPIYFDSQCNPLPGPSLLGCPETDLVGPARTPVLLPCEPSHQGFCEAFLTPEAAAFVAFLILQPFNTAKVQVVTICCASISPDQVCTGLDVTRMDVVQLRAARAIATEVMDLPARRAVLTALSIIDPTDQSIVNSAKVLTEQLAELNPVWVPLLARRPPYVPDPQAILHLAKVIYPGENSGGAVRSTSIVEAQAAQGLTPIVCLPIGASFAGGTPAQDGLVESRRKGVLINHINFPALNTRQVAPVHLLTLEAALYDRLARRHRCMLVHAASGFRGYEMALKGLAVAQANGLPFVYEVRSFHEHTWRAAGADHLADSVTRLRISQENRCMADADAVVTISHAMMDNLAERGVPPDKLFFVPNAITDDFQTSSERSAVEKLRVRLRFEPNVPVIGYISNFSMREGHHVLLDAFARLVAKGLKLNLLLVGDGPERPRLLKLAGERGLNKCVAFPGNVDHAEIKDWYGLLDLFVVPRVADRASDHVTPLKPFEAMSQGVPLLMSDRPVAREIVGEGELRGALVPSADSAALAAKIESMLLRPEVLRARAAAARDWVMRERMWANVVKRYDAVYAAARDAAGGQATRRRIV